MPGYASSSIEDAQNANRLAIGRDGAAMTAPGAATTGNGTHALTDEWEEVLVANADRRQVQIQNQSDTVAVFLRLADTSVGSGAYRVDPGVTYSFPYGVSWRGSIFAKAATEAEITVIEFTEPPYEEAEEE